MSPFWASLFDHLKDCGRNATIFLAGLAGFSGALVVGTIMFKIVHDQDFHPYLPAALTGTGLVIVVWSFTAIRRAFGRDRERLRHPPLSCDELRVARSKLLKHRDPKSV